MRNRFKVGEVLEILSPSDNFNKKFEVKKLTDEKGAIVEDAKVVQQKLYLYTDIRLEKGDILRRDIV